MSDKLQSLAEEASHWKYTPCGRLPGAVDCFGLIALMAEQGLGIKLPDYSHIEPVCDTDEFFHFMEHYHEIADPIERTDLLPGDVVLFNMHNRGFNHIGMFLGENRFIHCTKAGVSVLPLSRVPFNRVPKFYCRFRMAEND